jgi:protein-S-isoprenylcysteine O-methyltransferase Ste14
LNGIWRSFSLSDLATIRENTNWRQIAEGQLQHVGIVILLCAGAISLLRPSGSFLGIEATTWAITAIGAAILHQVIVALGFRLELHKAFLTRLWEDRALRTWGMIFFPLLIARPLLTIATAIGDIGTGPLWTPLAMLIGVGLLAIAAWTMHSVISYFGFARALGGDHFSDTYREMPLVREGAFRYSDNAMYSFAFLGLWGIALLFNSWNALVVALFQHAYIWVHMAFTEAPDMRRLYGPSSASEKVETAVNT